MLLSTMLSPRPSGAYRVPLETPPEKGEPDDPVGFATPLNDSQATYIRPVIVLIVPIAPGVYQQIRIRVPFQWSFTRLNSTAKAR